MMPQPNFPDSIQDDLDDLRKNYVRISGEIQTVQQQIQETTDLLKIKALQTTEDRLKKERRKIFEEIRQIENLAKSGDLNKKPGSPGYQSIGMHDLARLNFRKHCEIFRQWVRHMLSYENGTVFLLHGNHYLGCNHLVVRFRQEIERDFYKIEVREVNFHELQYPDIPEFINLVGEAVGLRPGCNLDDILERFTMLMHNCNFLILVIHQVDKISPATWILDHLWSQLLTRSKELGKSIYLSLIMICYQDLPDQIAQRQFDSTLSTVKYDGTKIIPLPRLAHFNQKDISVWLSGFSRIEPKDLSAIAKDILKATEGHPLLVYKFLERNAPYLLNPAGSKIK